MRAGIVVAIMLTASSAWALKPKEIYKKAGPAVVLLLGSDDGRTGNGGTGSIITAEGKIVTNAHVVISEASGRPYKTLYAFLKPPKLSGDNKRDLVNRYKLKCMAWSPAEQLDLALCQIQNPPPNLPIIKFADPDKVDIGDEVVAIGHPEQGGLWTLTTGTVSTVIANFNRVKGKHVFQTEASVNRGNSGGPLLDSDANLIGINTMIARQGAGGIAITGVNFALKSSVAVTWLAGTGMGLAYAPKSDGEIMLAVAPEPKSAATSEGPKVAPVAAPKPEAKPQPVKEPPPATIVVAVPPPKKVAEAQQIRVQAKTLGKEKAAEKVTGKRLDPAKAKPTYHTKKRPFSLADLRKQQIKELEDMMEDMRGKIRGRKSRGLGLW